MGVETLPSSFVFWKDLCKIDTIIFSLNVLLNLPMKLSGSDVLLMGRFLIRNSTSVIDNICKKGPLNFCIYFHVSFDHLDFSRNCLISSKLSDLVSLFIIFIIFLTPVESVMILFHCWYWLFVSILISLAWSLSIVLIVSKDSSVKKIWTDI